MSQRRRCGSLESWWMPVPVPSGGQGLGQTRVALLGPCQHCRPQRLCVSPEPVSKKSPLRSGHCAVHEAVSSPLIAHPGNGARWELDTVWAQWSRSGTFPLCSVEVTQVTATAWTSLLFFFFFIFLLCCYQCSVGYLSLPNRSVVNITALPSPETWGRCLPHQGLRWGKMFPGTSRCRQAGWAPGEAWGWFLSLVPHPSGPQGTRAKACGSRCASGGALGAGPGVLTAGNGVTAGCSRQDPLMFEAKYFRGDTAGGFASTKKGVFSWHNRSVVIVGEEGGTPSATTSKVGSLPQAALDRSGRNHKHREKRNRSRDIHVLVCIPSVLLTRPQFTLQCWPLQNTWDGKRNFLAK